MPVIKLIVEGGEMKPGPAVAQQLGPMGINLGKVIQEVNAATSGFKGMKVPVQVDVNPKTKQYSITVSSPPVSELIKKEVSADKGSGMPHETKIGNLAIEQVISIAKTKLPGMLAKDLKAAVKLVTGSCVSLGVLIESKPAKEVEQELKAGVYDREIKAEKTEVSADKKQKLAAVFYEVRSQQEARAKAREAAKAAEEAAKAAAAPTAAPAAGAAATGATSAPAAKSETAAKPEAKKK
jgi:large subunit ribosomal protein L11